jgi:hypothetical protein
VFHILDSLPNNSLGIKEGRQLQTIMLNHFGGEAFKEGRIRTNVAKAIHVSFHFHHPSANPIAQVPHQLNSKDCGCFAIYFARKFFSNPDATMALIKVISSIYLKDLY